jgi:two-component system, sensor histidine kinase PdtaS
MLSQTPPHAEATRSLTLAIIESSDAPLLLLDGDFKIIAASASFCKAFKIDPVGIEHSKVTELGNGEWDVPQLTSLLAATASGFAEIEAYEIDLKRPGQKPRRLVLNAHKLDYGDDDASVRIMLAIVDVTDARLAEKLKDDLLREKAILMQELQHRVANSLQIVASVLMQSARRVQSEEARGHLTDAHSRVMSIATLQQQLMASRIGDVELGPYLTALCQSIGASMIHDRNRITLNVTTDESKTSADVSVSLGLIVTELVINALKHAFPGRTQKGAIAVDYHADGQAWTLSVSDDGIGIPAEPAAPATGLGTSIVAALARQLDATVDVSDNNPGTSVRICHI